MKDFDTLLGKIVKIVAINGKLFVGPVEGYETPEDSEDGQWWLDVDVDGFGLLTIAKSEIKSLEVI
ncbi:hypothetical protein [Limosilactobacillus equigenerosi]|uniref:Uncharacterized protein n=1 Tax=Limosilactobacillus equigenerosi DSM 18793 = JCM 14505 TaxID=1423742 RepID=A0A0R1UZU4_9LACO|nr:hypothetical protein [Limosilactobacillus equigenerosi]KRL96568.1 hypothetical protein FC21_GL000652 [Limosilactobacillus equigenerosi DSM 18793 = JCM 14505]